MSNGDAANHWRAIEEEKLRGRIKELEAVAEAAVALLEPDTDESYPSIDYAKQERCKQLLCLALRAAGYLQDQGTTTR